MKNIKPQSFTVQYDYIVNELRTEIYVSNAIILNDKTDITGKFYVGIWDTGATNSVISKRIIRDFMLEPIDIAIVHHAGGVSKCYVYLVSIVLPNKVRIPTLSVTEGTFEDDFDLLIGMDIINKGDFAVTNQDNKTLFSFRYPSTEQIDFLK